jgi:hypothetical protein
MSALKHSLIAAAIAAALTAGVLHHIHKCQAREAESLRDANNQMRFQAAMTCRQQITPALSPAPVVTNQSEHTISQTILQPAPLPVASSNDYRNEGQATPLATLQTFAWACDRGDTATIATLLHFDTEARKKAESYMATLPEGARARWRSPDDMAATYLAAANIDNPFPTADILQNAAIAPTSADRVTLRLPSTLKDNTQYQKSGDIWKYVITETMVDRFLERSSQTSASR